MDRKVDLVHAPSTEISQYRIGANASDARPVRKVDAAIRADLEIRETEAIRAKKVVVAKTDARNTANREDGDRRDQRVAQVNLEILATGLTTTNADNVEIRDQPDDPVHPANPASKAVQVVPTTNTEHQETEVGQEIQARVETPEHPDREVDPAVLAKMVIIARVLVKATA